MHSSSYSLRATLTGSYHAPLSVEAMAMGSVLAVDSVRPIYIFPKSCGNLHPVISGDITVPESRHVADGLASLMLVQLGSRHWG